MTYYAFDPRESFREKIGTEHDIDENNENEWCFLLADKDGFPKYFPMYLSEEVKAEALPILPFAEMEIVDTIYTPHDIGGSTRKMEMWFDFHIYYTDTDDISAKEFGKKVKNKLQDLVRTYQCEFPGINWINVESDRYRRESNGRQVVFHYIASIYCLYYDHPVII